MFDRLVVFLHTPDLEQTSVFYERILGLPLVRDQGVCRIFKVSLGGYLGFCTHLRPAPVEGVIATLVVDDVDGWYERLSAQGVDILQKPAHNQKYAIYHFFFKDPNGYTLEIQRFDLPLD